MAPLTKEVCRVREESSGKIRYGVSPRGLHVRTYLYVRPCDA